MNKFKENDLVMVMNTGANYSGMYTFFREKNLPMDLAARYCYYGSPRFNGIYRVVFAGDVETAKEPIYCIESADMHKQVYLMGESGLEKVGIADKEFFEGDFFGKTYLCLSHY